MLKRILSGILAVTLALTIIPPTVFAKTNNILYGDVDVDGNIDLNDVLMLKRYIAEENPSGFSFINADVNVDNEADLTDLLMMKKHLAEWDIHLGPDLLTVSFYDGDKLIDALVANEGYPLGEVPSTEKTSKANAVFSGWYTDAAFESPFYADAPVTDNINVYAKYDELEGSTLTVTSFATTDMDTDGSFTIVGSGDINAVTLVAKDGSDPVKLNISGSGPYIVSAKDGFKEGASYELTIPDGFNFIGANGEKMPDTVRTASFTVAKDAVNNLQISNNVNYIQNSDPSALKEGDEIEISGVNVGDLICFYKNTNPKDRDYRSGNAYMEDPEIWFKVGSVNGNIVTLEKLDESDSEKIYDVPDNFPVIGALPKENGGTLTLVADDDGYTLDTEFYKNMVPNGETADLAYATGKISIGDFISIYTSSEKIDSENDIYFGKITAYDSNTGIITYIRSSAEEIETSMDLYVQPVFKGDDLLKEEEKNEIEEKVYQQVLKSGFAEEAGLVFAELAARTEGFRNMESVQVFLSNENGAPLSTREKKLLNLGKSFELKDGVELTVEIVSSGDQLHYQDKGSVQLNIGIDASFEVEVEDGGKIVIDLSATFVQEIAIGITASGELVKKEILFIPVPIGVKLGSAVDLLSYTGVSINVHAYTVAEEDTPIWEQLKEVMKNPEKLAEVLPANDKFAKIKDGLETVGDVFDKIDEVKDKIEQVRDDVEKAKEYTEDLQTLWEMVEEMDVDGLPNAEQWEQMGKALSKTNISEDLMDMLDISTETELDAERYADGLDDLLTKYSEMLEKETDWVKLVQEEMCQAEINICGLVIYLKADFVVRADMNIAMGASINYQVGKRYTFWVKVGLFKPTAGSSTMDLVDEQFALQFYVMGKIGLKMGVEATAGFAIGSADVARVGIHLEIGPYVKIYGFFIYEYDRYRSANTSSFISDERMAGAMYLDFGLYLVVGVDAAALNDLFEVSYDFIDAEFPLLEAGEKKYPYTFQYEPAEDDMVLVRDEDGDSTNGIFMTLPDEYRELRCVNLQDGKPVGIVYDWSKYNTTLSNPNFKIDENGVISVTVPENTRYMECDLTITYNAGKLPFSQYDMQVTIPLVWTNLSTEEISQYYTASVRVGNAIDGYETVFSRRVLKNQEFTLPTEEEIKELIGYNNAKYNSFTCFDGAGETATLIENTTYDCNVEYRSYSITVDGVQNSDGTTEKMIFTTHYGDTFDFSALKETGTSIQNVDPNKAKFTKYMNVTTTATVTVGVDKNGEPITEVIDLTQPITGKTAQSIAEGNVVATANYEDDSVLVTYTFAGINVPDHTERIRKGTASTYDFNKVAAEEGMMVGDISPEPGIAHSSVTYVVSCCDIIGESYTVSFEENGGSTVDDIERVGGGLIGTLPTPIRNGYTLVGWFKDEILTEQFSERLMPKNNTVLYAKWEANKYTVTLHVNGGDAFADPDSETKTVTYESTYGDLPTPTKSNHGFIGWFTEQDGGVLVNENTKVTNASNQTLYAHWKLLKSIPSNVFDFGAAESGTYSRGQTHDVLYSFTPEDGETYKLSEFTLKYMRQGNTEYETGLPVNAGTYDVVIIRPADNDYAKFEQLYTAVLTVSKATRSSDDFKNVALLNSSIGSGLNYVEVQLDPGTIEDFDAENTKVIFTAVNKQGNLVIPSEGATGKATQANKPVKIINLLPGMEYVVTFKIEEDPNYNDFTYSKYFSTAIKTLENDTSKYWTDYAEAFVIDESNKTVKIENEKQLAYLAKTVNTGTTYEGYTFTLMKDMYMLDYAWRPIGADYNDFFWDFRGSFDGDGHTVYGLHTSSETEVMAGLFGYVYAGGEVKNLTIAESYICGQLRAGAIAAFACGNIINCVNESTVIGYGDKVYVMGTGGIVGEVLANDEVNITGCTNNGRVDGNQQTGGIVGHVRSNYWRVTNNINNGPVKGNGQYLDGIVGHKEGSGTFSDNTNNGTVTRR